MTKALFHGVYAIGVSNYNDPATASVVNATVDAEDCPVNGKRIIITSRSGDQLFVNADAVAPLIATLIAAHKTML